MAQFAALTSLRVIGTLRKFRIEFLMDGLGRGESQRPTRKLENMPENEQTASTGQKTGLAGKILAVTAVVVAIGSLLDGLVAVTTKATTLTCNLTVSLPWCSILNPENKLPPATPLPTTPLPPSNPPHVAAPPAIPTPPSKTTPAAPSQTTAVPPSVPSASESERSVPALPASPPTPVLPSGFPPKSTWNHNDSVMLVTTQGDKIVIAYDQPRQRMINEGVRSGTVLFDGRRSGNKLSGTAYVFDRRCGPISYPDDGEVLSGERQFLLSGRRVPTQLNADCKTVGYRVDPSVFFRRD